MQHRSDIEDALANPRSRFSDLEDAFRALVDWPRVDMIRGLAGTDDALDLLRKVCDALVEIDDRRIMPADTVELLDHMAEGPEMVGGPWYATGAAFVRDRLPRWRAILRHADTEA